MRAASEPPVLDIVARLMPSAGVFVESASGLPNNFRNDALTFDL
jgi:hypothetical protein